MTTTKLVDLLMSVERGASGRSRDINMYIKDQNDKRVFITDLEIEIANTSDGVAGAQLTLNVKADTMVVDDETI